MLINNADFFKYSEEYKRCLSEFLQQEPEKKQLLLPHMVKKIYFVGLSFEYEIKKFDSILIENGIAQIKFIEKNQKKILAINEQRLKIDYKKINDDMDS